MGNARRHSSVTRTALVICGRCIDCAHPLSSTTMRDLLENQVAHDTRKHPDRSYLSDATPALRATVSTKHVQIDVTQRAL
jgi:hypothetical protein